MQTIYFKLKILRVKIKKNGGEIFEAVIEPANYIDLEYAADSGKFKSSCCNWREQIHNIGEVVKLSFNGELLGLMRIGLNGFDDFEIKYLETRDDLWKDKTYIGVGGCLIAYACLVNQENVKDDLYVMPNTEMKSRMHYEKKYGMDVHGEYLIVSTRENCERIIQQYLPQ